MQKKDLKLYIIHLQHVRGNESSHEYITKTTEDEVIQYASKIKVDTVILEVLRITPDEHPTEMHIVFDGRLRLVPRAALANPNPVMVDEEDDWE